MRNTVPKQSCIFGADPGGPKLEISRRQHQAEYLAQGWAGMSKQCTVLSANVRAQAAHHLNHHLKEKSCCKRVEEVSKLDCFSPRYAPLKDFLKEQKG